MLKNKIVELENSIASLKVALNANLTLKDRMENSILEARAASRELNDNLRNLRKNSVIVMLEEFGKTKRALNMVSNIHTSSEKTLYEVNTVIEKQNRLLRNFEMNLKVLMEEFNRDNVLEFNKKNG